MLPKGKVIGLNVRRLRIAKGANVRQLAENQRFSAALVSMIERGEVPKVSVQVLDDIAASLGVCAEDIKDEKAVQRWLNEKLRAAIAASRNHCYGTALRLVDDAFEGYRAVEDQAGKAESEVVLGDVLRVQNYDNPWPTIRLLYKRALDRMRRLVPGKTDPTVRERVTFALACVASARVWIRNTPGQDKDLKKASEHLNEANIQWDQIRLEVDEAYEDCAELFTYLSIARRLRGRIEEESGNPDLAKTYYLHAAADAKVEQMDDAKVDQMNVDERDHVAKDLRSNVAHIHPTARARAMLCLAKLWLEEQKKDKDIDCAIDWAIDAKLLCSTTTETWLEAELTIIRAQVQKNDIDQQSLRARLESLSRMAAYLNPAAAMELADELVKFVEALSKSDRPLPEWMWIVGELLPQATAAAEGARRQEGQFQPKSLLLTHQESGVLSEVTNAATP